MPPSLPENIGRPPRLAPADWPHRAIARRARDLWMCAGYPRGRDEEFWFEAKHRLFDFHDDSLDGCAGSPGSPEDRGDSSARRLLIVDDQTRFGWAWAAALRRAGFQLSIAANADAGWSTLDERRFALLITSQDGCGRRSLELIAKVRRRSRTMPCLLVREYSGEISDYVSGLLRPGVVVDRSMPIMRLLAVVRALLKAADDPSYVPVSASWGNTP